MRILLAAALLLSLSACSDWNGSLFGDDEDAAPAQAAEPAPAPPPAAAPAPAESMAETPSTPPPRMAGEHCTKLARQRASDAAYEGEDEETQRAVYDRTYAGCMDWDAKHAL